jgi:hypothetical protein
MPVLYLNAAVDLDHSLTLIIRNGLMYISPDSIPSSSNLTVAYKKYITANTVTL